MAYAHIIYSEELLKTQQFRDTLREGLEYVINQVKNMIEKTSKQPSADNSTTQRPEHAGAGHDALEPFRVMEGLRLQMQDLSKQVGILNLRFDQSSTKATMTVEEQNELLHLLSAEKDKNRKLVQSNNSLRNALIKPTQHIPDEDVENQFMKLSSSIRGYVQGTLESQWDESVGLSIDNESFFLQFKNKERKMKYLSNRVRGKVFAIIYENILSRSYYTGRYGNRLESLERAFLKYLPKANLKDFIDWRSASIKCSQALTNESGIEQNGNISDTPPAALPFLVKDINYIHNFFLPVKRRKGISEEKQLEKLSKVCLEAHNLVELMRRARDVFQVEFDYEYEAGDILDLVEVENSELTTSRKESGNIAFWTFGALTKRAEENPETTTIVVKGSVYMYKLVQPSSNKLFFASRN
ncbi:hypothetical protein F4679DRAFT_590870 [Xylaria curta]|nr:hypothetical protein F4679DRAFT_590870 [Xylaria curta]